MTALESIPHDDITILYRAEMRMTAGRFPWTDKQSNACIALTWVPTAKRGPG